ncbi:MAG: hypothetical protein ICV66_12115, partial [Chitinophagaceae bacterium]|nr:hypothetical protein [Chitinophagaceae bacterium]
MPDFLYILRKWWKKILGLAVIAVAFAAILLFLKPKQYLSVTTALPASSFASDKASVFNNNIQELYEAFGTPDDLERIIGTASLDTLYIAASQKFNLPEHYHLKNNNEASYKAALKLKKNSKILKNEYSELKIKVWDTDAGTAAQLANFLLKKLQEIHQA